MGAGLVMEVSAKRVERRPLHTDLMIVESDGAPAPRGPVWSGIVMKQGVKDQRVAGSQFDRDAVLKP